MKNQFARCHIQHQKRLKAIEIQRENHEAQEIFFFTGLAVLYFIFQVCIGPVL